MNALWIFVLCLLCFGVGSDGLSGNGTSRPAVVNVGGIFTFDSTIGRVAKIAIQEAVKDVNSNSSLLRGTKLIVKLQNSNCSGFLGMVGGTFFYVHLPPLMLHSLSCWQYYNQEKTN